MLAVCVFEGSMWLGRYRLTEQNSMYNHLYFYVYFCMWLLMTFFETSHMWLEVEALEICSFGTLFRTPGGLAQHRPEATNWMNWMVRCLVVHITPARSHKLNRGLPGGLYITPSSNSCRCPKYSTTLKRNVNLTEMLLLQIAPPAAFTDLPPNEWHLIRRRIAVFVPPLPWWLNTAPPRSHELDGALSSGTYNTTPEPQTEQCAAQGPCLTPSPK